MQQPTAEAEIYLLTGFFGAGKTTIIRKLLNNPHQHKYAVIQNQFAEGQMGIEQPLIVDQTGTPFSNFLELPNGCICCSAKNDLVAAIQYVIANTPVRKILVETNGMADPVQSIKQFWFDEEALIKAKLHSVIAVVNAKRWTDDLKKPLFERQIASSNQILVSFVDQVDQKQYETVVQGIKDINFQCTIERNDLEDLTHLFSEKWLFNKQSLLNITTAKIQHHGSKIRPVFIKGTSLLHSQLEIQQTLGQLLWQSGLTVMRIKGIVCLKDHPTVFELQGVEDVFEVKPTNTSQQLYSAQTRILCIGQNLNSEQLYTLLKVSKE